MSIDGRDVQCSSCDTAWFQPHPDAENSDEDTLENEIGPQKAFAPQPPKSSALFEPAAAPKPSGLKDGPVRKPLDPSVAEVLREEAENERRARRGQQSDPLESQPDLGLDDLIAKVLSSDTTGGDEKSKGEPPTSEALAASSIVDGSQESRRDRLPNIDEINSTLRSNKSRSPDTDPGQTAQIEKHEARSSRLGFSLVVALFAALALVYVFSSPLAKAVPEMEPTLTTYTAIVESWRGWLDQKAANLVTWLEEAAASSTP